MSLLPIAIRPPNKVMQGPPRNRDLLLCWRGLRAPLIAGV